jgi:kynurenine formamidase
VLSWLAVGSSPAASSFFDGPAFFEKDALRPGDVIHGEDLDRWFAAIGVTPRAGDALVVRLGRDRWSDQAAPDSAPGLDVDVVRWLRRHDASLLVSDFISDCLPSPTPECRLPVHVLSIVALGMWLVDNADLAALSEQCTAQATYSFLFVVAPLVMRHATGSLVNPLAIF